MQEGTTMTVIDNNIRLDRETIIVELRKRDGYKCQLPSCGKNLDFNLVDGPHMVTIDHVFPQAKARELGWTEADIWDLDNLALMHRRCNALKADREYDENGFLPALPSRQKAVDKSLRTPVCDLCYSGRLLLHGEICELCGSGPQPATAPRYLRVEPSKCSHGWGENPDEYCWMCYIGHYERKPAVDRIIDGP
jgi:5-methylcytosine-specific restriction endonuclease McrA